MTTEEMIQEMEGAKKANHPIPYFRKLLDEHLPGHASLSIVQVAGTNGKGSTIQWMAASAPEHTGTFISPHLISHFERMAIDGIPISASVWTALYEKWRPLFLAEAFTMFEMDLWMALDWFLSQHVQLALMETGLGGGKDAVSALDCKVKALTNIGMDHMGLLGNTLEEIALAKAGMFRKDVPVFTTETAMFPLLKEQAQLVGCPLISVPVSGNHIPAYQNANASLAKAVMEYLGYAWKSSSIVWPARFQVLRQNPLVLLDGAHNVPGIEALIASLPPIDHIYCSFMSDKEGKKMIELLQSVGDVTLVDFDASRLADLSVFGLREISFDSFVEEVRASASPILICGSLYFAGKVLECLELERS
jgi:dihydrofolate synthase/folylpolyglutamate synthase